MLRDGDRVSYSMMDSTYSVPVHIPMDRLLGADPDAAAGEGSSAQSRILQISARKLLQVVSRGLSVQVGWNRLAQCLLVSQSVRCYHLAPG